MIPGNRTGNVLDHSTRPGTHYSSKIYHAGLNSSTKLQQAQYFKLKDQCEAVTLTVCTFDTPALLPRSRVVVLDIFFALT